MVKRVDLEKITWTITREIDALSQYVRPVVISRIRHPIVHCAYVVSAIIAPSPRAKPSSTKAVLHRIPNFSMEFFIDMTIKLEGEAMFFIIWESCHPLHLVSKILSDACPDHTVIHINLSFVCPLIADWWVADYSVDEVVGGICIPAGTCLGIDGLEYRVGAFSRSITVVVNLCKTSILSIIEHFVEELDWTILADDYGMVLILFCAVAFVHVGLLAVIQIITKPGADRINFLLGACLSFLYRFYLVNRSKVFRFRFKFWELNWQACIWA